MNPQNSQSENIANQVAPIVVAPSVLEPTNNKPEVSHSPFREFHRWIILLVCFFILLSVGTTGVFASLIAYDKITLSDSILQAKIRALVLSFPLAPKTSAYVIERTALATNNIKSGAFNATASISSSSLETIIGSDTANIEVNGSIDKTEKNNLQSHFSIKMGDSLAVDINRKDQKVYANITTIPVEIITSILPIPEASLSGAFSKPIDISDSISTATHQYLTENTQNRNVSLLQGMTDLLNNKSLVSKISLTTEQQNGVSVYKLHPQIDSDFVKEYVNAFGTAEDKSGVTTMPWLNSLKDLNVNIFVNKNTFLVTKLTISFGEQQGTSILAPLMAALANGGNTKVNIEVNFSDYGKSFPVSAPQEFKKLEDVEKEIIASLPATESAKLIKK